ncbi:hypothetical protein [Maricaulis sp.]|uniref:hypothetical protein n=1 Tax=Maricaulis sp. TaxID=1486257 RepID=UPI003A8D0F41
MARRPRHPDKAIEVAIAELVALGWRYEASGKSAHAWGKLRCPQHDATGCTLYVWSTPRVPEHHARDIRRAGRKCGHMDQGGGDG